MSARVGAALVAAALGVAGCSRGGTEDRNEIVLFAAASLGPALDEIAADFERHRDVGVRCNYASSSTLAMQIEAGAPADVFVSANPRWMDRLVEQGKVREEDRRELVGNSLVIVAPAGRTFAFDAGERRPLGTAFRGRLALGDPDHVPAGEYARSALVRAGWWDDLAPRVVPASDARAALALVERRACAAGIVYASDAATSPRVEVVAPIPESWHAPIVYPAALVAGADGLAADLLAAFETGDDVFRRHGFRIPPP